MHGDNLGLVCLMGNMTIVALTEDIKTFLLSIFLTVYPAYFWLYFKGHMQAIKTHETNSICFLFSLITISYCFLFKHNKDSSIKQQFEATKTLICSLKHELKTPIAILMLKLRKIRSSLQEPEYQQTAWAIKTIDVILETFTHNTNTDPKTLSINKSSCNISECVHKALDTYPFDRKYENRISCTLKEDFLIQGNEELMIQVLYNLLKNALYYIEASPNKGKISIVTKKRRFCNILYFLDTGTGIERENLPHIFNAFTSFNEKGTGLGLYFCKTVLRAMDGEITCRSKKDKYTLFKITFNNFA